MPRKRKSKTQRIITWLNAGKTIHPVNAWNNFKVMRLASIIHYLRHSKGMDIITDNSKGFAKYRLIK